MLRLASRARSAPASQQYCDSYSIPVTFSTGGKHLLRVTFSGHTNVNRSFSTYNFPVSTNTTSSVSVSSNVITANYAGDAVLQASSGGPATIAIADYSTQAQPSTLVIPAGQSGSATLTILPLGGSTQTVQVSCGTDA